MQGHEGHHGMNLAYRGHEEDIKALSHAFEEMMQVLFEEKGSSLRIGILRDKAVKGFIGSHSAILDRSMEKVEMSDVMKDRLSRSNYIFSGMKTFHELNEAFPQLIDKDGNRKSFERFLKDVRSIDETYNRNYLRAEYNFVNASATMAAKWEQFEEEKDRYHLQYRTVRDDKVREEHAKMDRITLPVDDPFWNIYYPPNGWNCRCSVIQVRKSKYPVTPSDEAQKKVEGLLDGKNAMFRFNPGKEQRAIPKYNPYTIKDCKSCPVADDKLAKIPKSYMCNACALLRQIRTQKEKLKSQRKEIKKKAKDLYKDNPIMVEGFHKPINVSRMAIKEWVNQPFFAPIEKNKALLNLPEMLNNGKYLGAIMDKHDPMAKAHIFEITIRGKNGWVIIRELHDGTCVLHSISDSPKLKDLIK